MAEPIGPKFCVGPNMVPVKVYEWPKFQKISLQQSSISIKSKKMHEFF